MFPDPGKHRNIFFISLFPNKGLCFIIETLFLSILLQSNLAGALGCEDGSSRGASSEESAAGEVCGLFVHLLNSSPKQESYSVIFQHLVQIGQACWSQGALPEEGGRRHRASTHKSLETRAAGAERQEN